MRRTGWVLLALLAGIALAAAEVLARPGGGQSFGGGGGDIGGGGGGDGAILYMLFWLVIRYPHVGIPVVIVVGVGWFILKRRKGDSTTRSAVRRLERAAPRREPNPLVSKIMVDRIKARDPDFDHGALIEAARKGAEALTRAWCAERLGDVQRFLTDGVMNRFQVLLDLNRRRGVINVMADASIVGVSIAHVESDDLFDTVHMRVVGEARDMDVPLARLADKDALLASRPRTRYVEYWSLLRRRGARTVPGRGPLEGMCPNCGAPLDVSDSVRCDHCEVVVNSGEHGWVLAEITQESEWRQDSAGATVPGLDDLRSSDEGLSRQAIEDRASYLFWKWIQAMGTYDAAPLGRVASKDFGSRVAGEIGLWAEQGSRVRISMPAVGSVDLAACTASDDYERAFVRVRWSSAWYDGSQPTPSTEILVLARRTGSRSPSGLSYARCSECGGPLPSTDAAACAYCGHTLALDERVWFIETIGRPEAVAVPSSVPTLTIPDLSNPRDRMALLTRMAAVVAADGTVDAREQKLVRTMARRWSIPFETVEPILGGAQPPPGLSPTTDGEKSAFLRGLVMAALVDGRVDARERRMIHEVASSLGLPQEAAEEMIGAEQRRTGRGG